MTFPFKEYSIPSGLNFSEARERLDRWNSSPDSRLLISSSEVAVAIIFKPRWKFYNPYLPFMRISSGKDQARLSYRMGFNPAPLILGIPMVLFMTFLFVDIGFTLYLFFTTLILGPPFLFFWMKEGKLRRQVFEILDVE